ncbi:N-acetylmuramoyl-L-alanine amidase [Loktanella sp. S4079]|uniref:N-acetylmuramoyl-L-alanine amidase n=1 Tax=Loktanella sp. S4079 TaxID=579483 RepID=UPI00061E8B3A|nr:N-acetylmuramoyl-L-alanine amidase [Loktanella sp. S4079]KJZ19931.1 N-acetylmuramoyl-L-alanine amidase [Loktanella sp. S4079]
MIRAICLLMCWCVPAFAQVAIDADRTAVRDGWWTLEVQVALSDVTPYRLFTLDNPRRLVVDIEGAEWPDVSPETLLSGDRAKGVHFGALNQDWSRMIVDLARPLAIEEAAMKRADDGVLLNIVLGRTDAKSFAVDAGAPSQAMVFDPVPVPLVHSEDAGFIVVIDPGHGGIDPGALRGGIKEAELMRLLGLEVAQAINQIEGVTAVMTRDQDLFVPLDARVTFARAVGADLFISLHADALEEDDASGASVYTLSQGGGSDATQRMIERHARGDLLAGVDLVDHGDDVASVLMDLARSETGPKGRAFAEILIAQMRETGVHVNSRPHRHGQLAVLTPADFPSVLLEVGFLSNAQDRARLTDVGGRSRIVAAIRNAIQEFVQ